MRKEQGTTETYLENGLRCFDVLEVELSREEHVGPRGRRPGLLQDRDGLHVAERDDAVPASSGGGKNTAPPQL